MINIFVRSNIYSLLEHILFAGIIYINQSLLVSTNKTEDEGDK